MWEQVLRFSQSAFYLHTIYIYLSIYLSVCLCLSVLFIVSYCINLLSNETLL